MKKSIRVPEFTTVDELAQSLDVTVQKVIMACIGMGMMVTINQRMDMDSIVMIADEFGFDVETVAEFAEEETSNEESEDEIKPLFQLPTLVKEESSSDSSSGTSSNEKRDFCGKGRIYLLYY